MLRNKLLNIMAAMIVGVLLYVLGPDPVTGPVDDVIVVLIAAFIEAVLGYFVRYSFRYDCFDI